MGLLKWLAIGLAALALVFATLTIYGAWRWRNLTRELTERLRAAAVSPEPSRYDPSELDRLPEVVQRYFRAALPEGTPIVAAASVTHTGTFNLSEAAERWVRFSSSQRVVTRRPGFVWDGRMNMFPGFVVRVHDAYIAGEGILHPAILGLFSLTELRGTPEVAHGELMRFFAEAAWYPTALLPSQGVRWEPLDDRSARATLADGAVSVTLTFTFGADGLIESCRSEARGRTAGDRIVPTPWEGRWSNYARHRGMLVPMAGEVAWLLPEGRKTYWRGVINSLEYEFAAEQIT